MELVFIDESEDEEETISIKEIVTPDVKEILKSEPPNDFKEIEDMELLLEKKRRNGEKVMEKEISKVDGIKFGLYSTEEIMKIGVCEVNSIKLNGRGSIYDMRMGTIENKKKCESCKETDKKCTGHFGYIKLNVPIIHPLPYFRKIVLDFLKIFCIDCSSLLLSDKQTMLIPQLDGLTGRERFTEMITQCSAVEFCPECETIIPKYIYKDCKYYYSFGKKNKGVKNQLTAEKLVNIFDNIKPSDIDSIGINSKMMHPKNIIIRVLPVCPPSARPFVIEGGKIFDDDLSSKYLEIVKQNIKLSPEEAKKRSKQKRGKKEFDKQKCIGFLEFHIKTLMDNSDNKAKHTNGRPLKGIKQRMNGKGNLLRSRLTGKRVDFSSRTVAGPDASLRINEVGLPPKIMDVLTIPQIVYKLNKSKLEKEIDDGNVNFIIRGEKKFNLISFAKNDYIKTEIGDMILRGGIKLLDTDKDWKLKKGDRLLKSESEDKNEVKSYIRGGELIDPFKDGQFKFKYGDRIIRNDSIIDAIRKKRKFKLMYGDKVEVKYKNGDPILVNRQPTLHKGSMMVFKAKKIQGKTIRLPLCVTGSFNCDFDGDELNLHAPQDMMSIVECKQLCNVGSNLMCSKGNNSLISMVQDALIGSYLMTSKNIPMSKGEFFDITMKCDSGSKEVSGLDIDVVLNGVERYVEVMKSKGKYNGEKYTSRCLWSLILPPDFHYQKLTKGMEDEPVLKIERGIIYEGALTKKVLGKSHNSILQTIFNEYGNKITISLASNIQFITDAWLLTYGFSLGLKDCFSDRKETIKKVLDCIDEAEIANETVSDKNLKEVKINNSLNKARDVGIKIATEMKKGNPLGMMIVSGAKGDYVNIAQISGLLGQQNIAGGRVKPELSSGLRTLSQYKFVCDNKKYKYESQGFISGSFYGGLNPREFFFHAMSGREGLVNTSCKTSTSGYIQRRMVKVMEDLQVNNDMTVRNNHGTVIQFNYGEDNLNPSKLLKLKHGLSPVNIQRLADKLNREVEMKM